MRIKYLIVGIVVFTVNFSVEAQQIDIDDALAPLYRDPIFDGVADPSVIWNKKNREWVMYYTQRRARLEQLPGVEYCYGSAIGVAISTNNGVTWTYKNTANLPQPDYGLNTFWAPNVVFDVKRNLYHMFVTYIKGVFSDWGGDRQIFRYTSSDMYNWEFAEKIATTGCIDATVIKLNDNSWKMWYKDEKRSSHTYTAISSNLTNWKLTNESEVSQNGHEGPVVFKWKGKYWMLTDKWNGLDAYVSDDAKNWKYNNTILSKPGMRPDDNVMGRHADVKILKERAYIFYFTHPGRVYNDGKEVREHTYRYNRTSVQLAELELENGKLICNRDKYIQEK